MTRFSIVLAVLVLAALAAAQTPANQATVITPSDDKLVSFPGLPECARWTVTHGNPANGASVIYAKWPAGCEVPTHWHTPNEQLTIINGEGVLHMKGAADQKVGSGSFVYMPSKHPHAFRCTSACTFYLASDGAFDMHYVDAAGKEISPQQALAGTNETKSAAKEQ